MLPLLALGLLGLAAVLLGGRPERLAVAAALFALASLYAIELLFSARYAYYVPATFGDRRVFEYAGLPLLVLGAAGVNALFGRSRVAVDFVRRGIDPATIAQAIALAFAEVDEDELARKAAR